MSTSTTAWVALAATTELPIAEAPARAALAGTAEARTVALPYRKLSDREEAHWAGALAGAAGILLRSGYVTASLLDRLPDLKVIGVHGAGVDPVDVPAATARGVWVTNAPGANADAVTELTFGLMLSFFRRIPEAAHRMRAERAWDAARHTGRELKGRTLGLVGLGQIGQRVAAIARAFGMTVVAHDPALDAAATRARGAEPVTLAALYAAADVISLHAPAIPQTRHMINAAAIAAMKPGALVVNCARGSLIDEAALGAALVDGRLGRAALDVFDGEPPDPASPIFTAPNVVMTPHMAGSTHECLATIARTAGEDIARVLRGEPPSNPVNAPGGR